MMNQIFQKSLMQIQIMVTKTAKDSESDKQCLELEDEFLLRKYSSYPSEIFFIKEQNYYNKTLKEFGQGSILCIH